MDRSAPEPILVACEGAGCPGHRMVAGAVMCSMCGQVAATDDTVLPPHQRQDIVAMVRRGDFG